MFVFQSNSERKSVEEMQQAEAAGYFIYVPTSTGSTTTQNVTETTTTSVPPTTPQISEQKV